MNLDVYEDNLKESIHPNCSNCRIEMEKVDYLKQIGVDQLKSVEIFVCPQCRKAHGAGVIGN